MIKNSKKIRGGELLARALVEKGVEDVFTLSGGFCNPALEGFMNCGLELLIALMNRLPVILLMV